MILNIKDPWTIIAITMTVVIYVSSLFIDFDKLLELEAETYTPTELKHELSDDGELAIYNTNFVT